MDVPLALFSLSYRSFLVCLVGILSLKTLGAIDWYLFFAKFTRAF